MKPANTHGNIPIEAMMPAHAGDQTIQAEHKGRVYSSGVADHRLTLGEDRKKVATITMIATLAMTAVAIVLAALAPITGGVSLIPAGFLLAASGGLVTLSLSNRDNKLAALSVIGMMYNIIKMKEKDLSKCGLDTDMTIGPKTEHSKKSQWAHTVYVAEAADRTPRAITLMAMPTTKMVHQLKDMGYKTIISAQQSHEEDEDFFGKNFSVTKNHTTDKDGVRHGQYVDDDGSVIDDLEQLMLSADDFDDVPLDILDKAADLIHKAIQEGHVAIHCKSGKGRSAQFIAAYLMKYQNRDPFLACQECIDIVCAGRKYAAIHKDKHRTHLAEYGRHLNLGKTSEVLLEQSAQFSENIEESTFREYATKLKNALQTQTSYIDALNGVDIENMPIEELKETVKGQLKTITMETFENGKELPGEINLDLLDEQYDPILIFIFGKVNFRRAGPTGVRYETSKEIYPNGLLDEYSEA